MQRPLRMHDKIPSLYPYMQRYGDYVEVMMEDFEHTYMISNHFILQGPALAGCLKTQQLLMILFFSFGRSNFAWQINFQNSFKLKALM